MRNKKAQALGGLAVATIAGMAVRAFAGFLGALAKPVEMVANIIVFLAIVLIAFGAIFSGVGLALITSNMIIAVIFFFGIGYAAVNLIMSLFNL